MKDISFDERYAAAPVEMRDTLRTFRRTHPYTRTQIDGQEWDYVSSGKGKQALLILGGAMSTGETSFRSILRLEDRFRVISPSYPACADMHIIAEGLAELIRKEGFEKAHIWGHSMGAAIGHAFIRLKPECVDKLVLDGFGLYTRRSVTAARWFFKLPYSLLVAYYRRKLKSLLKAGPGSEASFYAIYLDEVLTRIHTRETLMSQFYLLMNIVEQAAEYQVFERVEKPGHILLILAKDDRGFTDEERQALIETYPGASLHLLESGGHLAGFSNRQEFDGVLDEFLLG